MTVGDVPSDANVLIVRHGQSEWNAIGRWQGQADPPLSTEGHRQATAAGETLAGSDLDAAVTSSDLERARATAKAMAARAGLDLLDPDPAFRERTAGDWEGLTRTEIEARYPGWIDDGRRPPGWETDDAVVARAIPALGRLTSELAGRLLIVVSHGGLIRSLEQLADPESHRTRRFANLEGRWFGAGPHGIDHAGSRVHLLPADVEETFGPDA